jgi:hypothetical protein
MVMVFSKATDQSEILLHSCMVRYAPNSKAKLDESMNGKVLLSYSSQDRHRVELAIAQLPGVGMTDSLESELRPGDDV